MPIPRLLVGLVLLVLPAAPTLADWTLDPARSHLTFISIKAKDVAEVHTFEEMSGSVNPEGKAQIALMLDSVETMIPIRNERMRQFLFETTQYQKAILEAKVDPAQIDAIAVGSASDVVVEGNLSLHGQSQPLTLNLHVARLAEDTLKVSSAKPVIVNAGRFGLSEGVEKLREIAGLPSISTAVPVQFVLTLVDDGQTG